ncbi:MAG: YlxM family DNA-binding protein [Bacillota bacterium]|nr:YlxM family DNA-binding protein [Bacillota bacterium]
MEKTLRMSLLYDFYGPLLTERQQDVYLMYFQEDLSLGEIGEQLDVSRQAIYDNLKRAEAILEGFEDKLGLISKFEKRQEVYEDCLILLDKILSGDKEYLTLAGELKNKIEYVQATG